MQVGKRYGGDRIDLLFAGLSQKPDRMQALFFVVEQTQRPFGADADQFEFVRCGEKAERLVCIEFEYDR